jgi:signal peptidase
MLKEMAKLFEWVFFTIIVLTVLTIASPLLPTRQYLHVQSYIVSSGSMEPTVQTGALALTAPVDSHNLHVSDIIAFTSPKNQKQIILHRINKIKNNSFETKGDNNNVTDIWIVPSKLIQGKYIFSVPLLGHAAAFFKTPLGFGIIVGAPALILIILFIKKINVGINEEVEKRLAAKNTPLQS